LTPLIGNVVTTDISSPQPYDPSRIFYEPIPMDFLYTNETKPQIVMTMDGLPAACGSLLCDYNYIPPIPQIIDFSLSGTTLTIDGTAFPL